MARLELSYCEIRSDLDGFVSNRNVNPGDRVTQGQRLLAVRSGTGVWIDANFKETQLAPIRIGHPVDLHLDAYPGKTFRGRVTGFNPGTGASTALFSAQNATRILTSSHSFARSLNSSTVSASRLKVRVIDS